MAFFTALLSLLRPRQVQSPEDCAAEEALRKRVVERCQRFRRLLSSNKSALEGMAEMEESLHGTAPYSMSTVRRVCTRVGTSVFQMVQNLNALSDNAYADLVPSFSRISTAIEDILACPPPHSHGPLVLHLSHMGLENIHEVGGKMANLGEVCSHAGMPVPDGFAVTASAYHLFMAENGLQEEIDRRIQATNIACLDDVFSLSASIQQLIQSAPMPVALEKAITQAVEDIYAKVTPPLRPNLRLALRSSALGEDALGASFAGQYHSELNVHPDEALDVWRDIIASKYAVTAMHYRFQRGIPDDAVPMCVGVLSMVDAQAGGVAYSRDPMAPLPSTHPNPPAGGEEYASSRIIINAVLGLPMAVVDGSFSPDVFTLTRTHPPRLLEQHIAQKPFRFVCDPNTRLQRMPLSPDEGAQASISPEILEKLASMVLALEEYYQEAQDVEWAVDAEHKLIILQSRPLKQQENTDSPPDQQHSEDSPLPASYQALTLLMRGGTSVSGGVGMGKIFHARKDADILAFPPGGVLVVEHAQARWATLLSRAAALIAEAGGTAGHLASVAREYRVPAIFALNNALDTLVPGTEVTVDTAHQCVLAGLHPELSPPRAPQNLMLGSPVHQSLCAVAPHIIPLHLLDPSAPEFAPAHCQSLHDITRFCHEKAVELLFSPAGEDADTLGSTFGKQLKAGVKLQYWIIDAEDGFTEPVSGPYVDLSNIRSAPMLALWQGMTAVPWTGPPATDASGFMSVVFESTMNRDLEASTASPLSTKNFLMISSTFMNLQARFGYHFCTAESQAGKDSHENYVSFQFKGGAASLDRRKLRAQMVGRLLESYGFRVDIKEDALFATAEGYSAEQSLKRTALLGYLVIHTRQVDMIMHNTEQAKALERTLQADMAHIFTL
ncbi:MAG: PEP/pyruvate-binding domain-containing protein [Desulfovibrionaceae bacterium]